jgi:MFS family permease
MILSTAIPKITDQSHALDDMGWYASSYLLTTCAFQLFWGKLFTYYPVKWTYLVALFVFELGSLICGVLPFSAALITGRAVAGAGTGGVNAGAYILVVVLCGLRVSRTNKTVGASFRDRIKQMDIPGTAGLLAGVHCLILGLQWGGSIYPWSSGRIIALFVFAARFLGASGSSGSPSRGRIEGLEGVLQAYAIVISIPVRALLRQLT